MWRSLLVGLNECHCYWIDNNHASMYDMSAQGMEHQIGNAKLFCKKQGCKTMDVVAQTADYLDLNCTGSVYRNQIQLKQILNQLLKEKKLIFDLNKTKTIEDNLIDSMPDMDYQLIAQLLGMKLGDEIPSSIGKIMSAFEDHNNELKHQKIEKLLREQKDGVGDEDKLENDSTEYLREKLRMDIDKREEQSKQRCNTKDGVLKMRNALNNT